MTSSSRIAVSHRRRALAVISSALILLPPLASAQETDTPPAAALAEADYAALVTRIVDGHILPSVDRLKARADTLAAAMDAACAAPSPAALGTARAAFAETVTALAALEPMRFGPLVEENRYERLAFWPDPRGLGLRQVQALLAAEDEAALAPGALAAKSVAVQGLTALEFVLHGTGSEALAAPADAPSATLRDKPATSAPKPATNPATGTTSSPPSSYRCRYGAALADNVSALAAAVGTGWRTGSGRLFFEPGPDNPVFLTHQEAAGEIIAGMATALEVLSDQKIKTILAESPERARPKLAPFWRSGQTFPAMAATLQSIADETQHLDIEANVGEDSRWLANAIALELRSATAAVQSLPAENVETAYTDQAFRAKLDYIRIAASSLKATIGQELSSSLGLEQGFNSLDGD